jgi:Cu2+-exporting ATPase
VIKKSSPVATTMAPAKATIAAEADMAEGEAGCSHCGEPCPPGLEFCCSGCETVYALLRDQGLTDYYRLADVQGPAQVTGRDYEEFDAPAFQELHVKAAPGGLATAELYLEGVRCAACVWLVEKLPRVLAGVRAVRLELGRSLARIEWDPTRVSLSTIARTLDRFGYTPHPYRGGGRHELRRAEDRAFLVRIAIAGALAGNVMLISFALYSGALSGMSPAFVDLFRWLAMLLTIPAVLGPGREFLSGAWGALRTGTPHMDLPIALALAVGLGWGAYNTVLGRGEIYFDTLTVLIFFLLVGRWLSRRQQRAALDSAELLGSLALTSARRVDGGRTQRVPLEALVAGDVVEVLAGESIPVDGEVTEGDSRIDASLLTGESRPVRAEIGEAVFAGTVNLSAPLRIRVDQAGEETRVGRLMKRVESFNAHKAPVVQWADRIAGRFVVAVIAAAALTFALWLRVDPSQAVDNAVALLIVTCPCALGLATPLAISGALGLAARHGILVKGGDVLQALAVPGRIWLDKTGTLTEGRTALLAWEGDDAVRAQVLGLEAVSTHPVADGFRRAFEDVTPIEPDAPAEQGDGEVFGTFGGAKVRVGSPASLERRGVDLPAWAAEALARGLDQGATPVLVTVEAQVVAVAAFGDPLRDDARDALDALRAGGWQVGILSGDHPRVVAAVGEQVGVPSEACLGARSPEAKLERVQADLEAGPVVMVGDGVNDAAALAAASAGIGVHGGSEATLTAADVFFAKPGLVPLRRLVALSRATLRRVRVNLAISLTYNVVAAILAMAGVISPLLAAILMPISSGAVVANSYRGRLEWK